MSLAATLTQLAWHLSLATFRAAICVLWAWYLPQAMSLVVMSIGFLTPTAGTATIPPLDFASGTLTTTAVAGAIEYDGTVIYGTPGASNRGVLDTTHFMVLAADYTANDSSSAQKVFNIGTGGAGAISLPSGTSYFMEAVYYITRAVGSNSHTLSTLFAVSNALTGITYTADTTSTAWQHFGCCQ
jgi:hypothetical protein